MAKNASPKRHLFIAKNLIMMLVLAVTIALAVFAWISEGSRAEASGISIRTKYASGIDIAPCIKLYNDPNKPYYDSTKDDYSVLQEGPGEFSSSLPFAGPYNLTKDCTGDGETLIVPDFNVTNDYEHVRRSTGKEVNLNHEAVDAVSDQEAATQFKLHPDKDFPEYQYIQLEFYARSKSKELQLADFSQMLSVTEDGGGSLSDSPSSSKKSAYGNFNVDGLVGAMRVSLLAQGCYEVNQNWQAKSNGTGYEIKQDSTDSPTAKFQAVEKQVLWVPRPDVFLNSSPEERNITDWTLTTSVNSGVTYTNTYYRRTASGVELVDPDNDSKTVVSSGTYGGIKCLGQTVNVSDFTYSDNLQTSNLRVNNSGVTNDDYYVTKFTMRIWIEGTDTEARRAMDGGEFSLKLFFQ